MMPSDDMGAGAAMGQFIEDEREFSGIETYANARFFDWKKGKGASTRTLTIVKKNRRECKNQEVG
jgi:hypothetical protein